MTNGAYEYMVYCNSQIPVNKNQFMSYINIYICLTIQSFTQQTYVDALFSNHSVVCFVHKD